jgi:hypothetical protein
MARPSRWANPYWPGSQSRAEAVTRYAGYLLREPDLQTRLPELRGRRLACYCPLE